MKWSYSSPAVRNLNYLLSFGAVKLISHSDLHSPHPEIYFEVWLFENFSKISCYKLWDTFQELPAKRYLFVVYTSLYANCMFIQTWTVHTAVSSCLHHNCIKFPNTGLVSKCHCSMLVDYTYCSEFCYEFLKFFSFGYSFLLSASIYWRFTICPVLFLAKWIQN